MKYAKEHQQSRDYFMVGIVIVFLLVICISQSGCGLVNGGARDVKWSAEKVIEWTQGGVEAERDSGIAFGICEQNRILRRGQELEVALGR